MVLSHLPIPRFEGLDAYKPDHPLLVYLQKLIDGNATLDDLAQRMIDEHGARPDAALDGTRALVNVLIGAARGERS
jgi:hypothetical protein